MEIERIEISNVVPAVFAGADLSGSEIWARDVVFEPGRRFLISAESGTGKSSLCSFIYGYRRDFTGDIKFGTRNVRSLSVAEWCDIRRRGIAYLPQDMRLFGELTSLENVELKNGLTGHKTRAQIVQMLEQVGLADKVNSLVSRMSIGQQQRVAIVRALCQPFRFLILDEPVSHLDETNNAVIATLVEREAQAQGAAVIATSVGNNVKLKADKEFKL